MWRWAMILGRSPACGCSAILQLIWERGQARRQAVPEAEREANAHGNIGQLDAAGLTLLTLTHHFRLSPEARQAIQALVRRVRKASTSVMSRRNQQRLDQFDDEVKLARLLNLPRTLMAEAIALRASQPVDAARLARTAVMIAIELRIPLRIKNLHSCRIEHNLRFAGPGVAEATLFFPASETKNHRELVWSVNARLCAILKTYIADFLPTFAAASPESDSQRWLFPAADGRPGPLSSSQVRNLITTIMAERVGVEFHPHLFRSLAIKLSLDHSPEGLEHGRQLLGDKTMHTVMSHYVPNRMKQAAARQDQLVNETADRLAFLAAAGRGRGKRSGGSS
jgi:integrase